MKSDMIFLQTQLKYIEWQKMQRFARIIVSGLDNDWYFFLKRIFRQIFES